MTHDTALSLLAEHSRGAAWARHCHAVADSALRLGHALGAVIQPIDHDFLRSAALLHDIGRHVTHDPVGHGVEGYHVLTRLGHGREAHVCAAHVLFGLEASDAERLGLPACDFIPRTVEERLVTLVDLLVENETPTTLNRRFSSLHKRNAGNSFFLSRLDGAQERAEAFMLEISEAIGGSVEDMLATQDDSPKPCHTGPRKR